MMIQTNHEYGDAQLSILLVGDEESAEFRKTASHVEACPHCQRRLTQLAADQTVWKEVCGLLSGYTRKSYPTVWFKPEAVSSSADTVRRSSEGEAKLDFLGPPSHPEMLGRLGRYEIERVIGSGGMGIVLKAFDTELHRPVAIKVLASHLAHVGAARQRFAREARAAAAVVHEHVVAIHNVDSDGKMPFLVMHYVTGESLQARVDREGPLQTKEILRIGIQAAAGLAAAHEQGVVHRDVKPANIMLEDGVERALLTDFGLARTVDDASLTHTGVVAGTPHYMSPEQATMEASDHRTDLFSLGAVLYFMATGHPPFRAERAMGVLHRICRDQHRPVWEVNPDIPDELSNIIDRLLQKNPNHRYNNATDLKQALTRSLAKIQQRPRSGRSRPIRLLRRHRQWMVGFTAAFGVTGLVAGLVLSGILSRTPAPSEPSPMTRSSTLSLSELFQQAASSEAQQYATSVEQLRQRVEQMETTKHNSFSSPGAHGPQWNQELESMRALLEKAQQ